MLNRTWNHLLITEAFKDDGATEPPVMIYFCLSLDDPNSMCNMPITGIQEVWIGTATSTLTLKLSPLIASLTTPRSFHIHSVWSHGSIV